MELGLAIAFALAFAFTNGIHDAANAIATLVSTRTARPAPAVAMSAAFNILGALLLGTAVANTIAGIVTVSPSEAVAVIGSGVLAATLWNLLTWWLGLPSSSGHALVGGLVGAGLAAAGSAAINWGGLDGLTPIGVFGVLIALAISPLLGFAIGGAFERIGTRLLRRATNQIEPSIRGAQWVTSATLSLSHGANDAQKMMGVIAALLLATGHLDSFSVPLWVKLSSGIALTVGTALGGWRIVRTVGRGIFHVRPFDGVSSQSGSTAVILGASYLGAPVSTTQVVASSVIGVGGGTRRWRHVRWSLVRAIGIAWLLTLPTAAALGAVTLVAWEAI